MFRKLSISYFKVTLQEFKTIIHQIYHFLCQLKYSLLDLVGALIEQKSLISCTFTLVLLSKRIDSIHNLHWPIRGLGNITWLAETNQIHLFTGNLAIKAGQGNAECLNCWQWIPAMFNCLFDFNIIQTFLNVPVSGHFLIHTQETNFHPPEKTLKRI